jgi:hypothetical protein
VLDHDTDAASATASVVSITDLGGSVTGVDRLKAGLAASFRKHSARL